MVDAGQLLLDFAVCCSNKDHKPDATDVVGLLAGPMMPPLPRDI
jgi:hypothetical protein